MKTEKEIKEAMETIKTQLTKETEPQAIAMLQGQFSSLEWILVAEDKETKTE